MSKIIISFTNLRKILEIEYLSLVPYYGKISAYEICIKEVLAMELWTGPHAATLFPTLAVMFLVSLLLRRYLKENSLEMRMLPVKIIAVLLLLLEIGKQGISLLRGYDLYHLPFHFCSLYLFMIPAMAFYRGKHQRQVCAINAAICASLFLIMLIYPNLIYSADNIRLYFEDYMSFHTVTFHNLVMLAALLIPALGLYRPKKAGETKAIILFIVAFCAVAATMAQLLQTNFANYYTCNIPVLESLRLSVQGLLGYWPAQLLYILILSAVNILFVLMSHRVCMLYSKLFSRSRQRTA